MSNDATGKAIIDYYFELEDREWQDLTWTNGEDDDLHSPAWTVAERAAGKFRMNWRISLGLQVPLDSNGFLVDASGAQVVKDGKTFLNSHIYLIDRATYLKDEAYEDKPWSLDGNGHLLNPDGAVVANSGEFLFLVVDDGLYGVGGGGSLGTKVADTGFYNVIDLSLWVTDENGCIPDPADGTCLVDTASYSYDNDGYLIDGGGTRVSVDGSDKLVVTDPGEKILSAASGAGGYLYFTSYTPKGGCAMGKSYFYGLKISSCDSTTLATGTIEYDVDGVPIQPSNRRRIPIGPGITPEVTLDDGTAYVISYEGDDKPSIKPLPVQTGGTSLLFWKQQ